MTGVKRTIAAEGSLHEVLEAEGEAGTDEDLMEMARNMRALAGGERYVQKRAVPNAEEAGGSSGGSQYAGEQENDMAKAKEKKAKGKKKVVKAVNGGGKQASTPRAESKTAKLIAAVEKGGTLKELSAASGFDERNTRTCIGILRSRKGMKIELDRTSGKYSMG